LGEEAGWLIDDQDVRIFVQDFEPARDLAGLGAIREELDRGVGRDLSTGLVAAFAVEVDPAVPHRFLGGPPREAEPIGGKLIEADRWTRWFGEQCVRGFLGAKSNPLGGTEPMRRTGRGYP
jgi:hypothetical protein